MFGHPTDTEEHEILALLPTGSPRLMLRLRQAETSPFHLAARNGPATHQPLLGLDTYVQMSTEILRLDFAATQLRDFYAAQWRDRATELEAQLTAERQQRVETERELRAALLEVRSEVSDALAFVRAARAALPETSEPEAAELARLAELLRSTLPAALADELGSAFVAVHVGEEYDPDMGTILDVTVEVVGTSVEYSKLRRSAMERFRTATQAEDTSCVVVTVTRRA